MTAGVRNEVRLGRSERAGLTHLADRRSAGSSRCERAVNKVRRWARWLWARQTRPYSALASGSEKARAHCVSVRPHWRAP